MGERGRDRIWGHTAFSRTEVSVKPFTLVRKLSGLFTNWSLRLKQSPFLSATCTNFTFLEVTALYSPFLCLLLLTLHLHCPSPPLSFTSPVLHLPWPSHALSFTSPVLHMPCPSPPLSFTCPVLYLPCTSHALSFTCLVLHFPCPSYALSFTSPVLHMPCPSPHLSFTCPVLYLPVLHLHCPSPPFEPFQTTRGRGVSSNRVWLSWPSTVTLQPWVWHKGRTSLTMPSSTMAMPTTRPLESSQPQCPESTSSQCSSSQMAENRSILSSTSRWVQGLLFKA